MEKGEKENVNTAPNFFLLFTLHYEEKKFQVYNRFCEFVFLYIPVTLTATAYRKSKRLYIYYVYAISPPLKLRPSPDLKF